MALIAGKVGIEVLVSTQTASVQFQPTITGLEGGGFVVSWTNSSGTGGDASGTSVKAQVFDAAGAKIGGELLVNTETASLQLQPTITALDGGGFVVSWTDESGAGGDESGSNVKAQVFRLVEDNAAPMARDGQAAGPEDTTIAGQVAATDADGDALTFALVQGARDADGNPVSGLTFNEDGSYRFQDPQHFAGAVSFTYTARDGTAAADEATVTLTVTPVNDAPMAAADRFGGPGQAVIYEGFEGVLDIADLLANDTDVDGDLLSFGGIVSGTSKGSVSVVSEGGQSTSPTPTPGRR